MGLLKDLIELMVKKVRMITAAVLLEADFRSSCADYLDLFKLTKLITFSNIKRFKSNYI
ncbi:MAG: hypothetical protein L6U99_12915 [Clostridium sp.]|nr:MAG: hypothetical protein L6U99_12915 [Clostridium sp.]